MLAIVLYLLGALLMSSYSSNMRKDFPFWYRFLLIVLWPLFVFGAILAAIVEEIL